MQKAMQWKMPCSFDEVIFYPYCPLVSIPHSQCLSQPKLRISNASITIAYMKLYIGLKELRLLNALIIKYSMKSS